MKNIVLTGGPCGGKSTALAELKTSLEKKGYKVFILDESATKLINKGIKPFGENAISMYDFQKIIMRYQLARETLIRSRARLYKNSVILYDRGVLDNKAYLDDLSWQKLLNELHLKEEKLMNRYDIVVHMVTIADGKEELYTTENNKARSEDAPLARKKDIATLNSYVGHPNLRVVDNSTDFKTKIERVKKCILSDYDNDLLPIRQYKFLVNINTSNMDKIKAISSKSYILQNYLKTDDVNELRIRQKITSGISSYSFTTKRKTSKEEEVRTKNISKIEYLYYLKQKDRNMKQIEKIRYSFMDKKEVYDLDVFEESDYAILENKTTKDIHDVLLPDYLDIIDCKDIDLSNRNIANAKNKKLIKAMF